ncbi:class I SAM-dependent methyltransferase [Desulforamulus hydrothermalis]|uniref:Methyltransferase type 11 n=1 Tax=Desulforamulus hydrothermalis Lam5 = DSM 18033 TaxID=1121428 RepID=K8E0P8_9FIRM|nr:class I SAM-dependent methyltransferase [Desulforamulus hydrothermalis]CCO09090.1 Methyltransferase type 11 [Desulforamulus hydrothermalis Lam5 = DSM 18033]SHG78774.1 Methyltransferase domain-containing protein [Desulforamulus hydrothermalis Lam5 = DSM 18033]
MNQVIYLNMIEQEKSHWWYKGRREIIGQVIKPYLQPAMKILDAGCGAGGNMEYMLKYGSVVGVDIAPEMVKHCRKKGLSAYCESITALPFADHVFDLVICLDVLEHLADERAALAELTRVVRPGGVVVVSVPAFNWLWGEHDILNNHYRRYNYGQLNRLVKEFPLSIERTTYFNFFLLPIVWAVRQFKNSLPGFLNKRTDLYLGSGRLNRLFYQVLKIEQLILVFCNLPVGVSQVLVARKK